MSASFVAAAGATSTVDSEHLAQAAAASLVAGDAPFSPDLPCHYGDMRKIDDWVP